MTQLPTDRSETDSVAEHTSDHNILNAQHNELDGHAADTSVHGIADTADLATQADVTAAINGLIDAAPGTLDTLNELAAALGDDANFASTMTTALAGKAATTHNHDAAYEATGAVATHTGDTSAAHAASAVAFTPTGAIAATDVQAAIAEVDSEKAASGHAHSGTYEPSGTVATHAAAADPHAGYLLESLLDAKGDLVAASANDTPARLPVGTDGQVLTASSGASTGLAWAAAGGGGNAIYGDGNDGVVNFDGTTTVLGLAPSSGVYALTRDVYLADGSQLSGTAVVSGRGFRVFCNGTLTIGSGRVLHNDGFTATSSFGGAGGQANLYGSGGTGGDGGTTTGNASVAPNRTAGGTGGNGGNGSSGAGAAGGAGNLPSAAEGGVGGFKVLTAALTGMVVSTSPAQYRGGRGGSGGGGDGTAGGGGGGGGGIILVAAKTLVNNGTIRSAGGNGFTPSGNRGGGGGGGGGVVICIYNSFTGNTPTAAGGTKGSGSGTGTAGTDGGAGNVFMVSNA